MQRVLSWETERLLGEVMVHLTTWGTENSSKILQLLHGVKRELRIGVKGGMPRHVRGDTVPECDETPAAPLSDSQVKYYENLIDWAVKRNTPKMVEIASALRELLDRYRDCTE